MYYPLNKSIYMFKISSFPMLCVKYKIVMSLKKNLICVPLKIELIGILCRLVLTVLLGIDRSFPLCPSDTPSLKPILSATHEAITYLLLLLYPNESKTIIKMRHIEQLWSTEKNLLVTLSAMLKTLRYIIARSETVVIWNQDNHFVSLCM